jgi:hypothetical protein
MSKPISVTTALNKWVNLAMVPTELLELASDRGTRVHKLIPSLIFPDQYPIPEDHIIEPDIVGYLKSFRDWMNSMVKSTLYVEKEIVCDCFNYIGHIDWIGILNGEDTLTVLDWKTPLVESKTWPCQIAAYWHLVDSHLCPTECRLPIIGRCGTIMLNREGRPAHMKEYTGFGPVSFNYFLQALNLVQYFGVE